jgi:two-component SAPR family response regulator
MKGLGGFELYEKMRKIDENIHICFISASNTYEKYETISSNSERMFHTKASYD